MSIFSYIHTRSKKRQHVVDLVIDVGTASVSAAFATVVTPATSVPQYEVGTIFNQHFNLLTFTHGTTPEVRAWHVVRTALAKTFADAMASSVSPRVVRISIASLFFKESTVQKAVTRAHPEHPISRAELDEMRDECRKEVVGGQDMVIIRDRRLQCTINGYRVADPEGYTGDTIQCTFQFLFISQSLYTHIHELLERYVPSVPVEFFSDADVLVMLAERMNTQLPTLIMDIGGEATSLYSLQGDRRVVYYPPIYFGIRTLERRIASIMGAEIDEAESVLHRFTAGTLHEGEWEKIQPTVEGALKDWWVSVSKEILNTGPYGSVLIAGAGRDMSFFSDIFKKQVPDSFVMTKESIASLVFSADHFIPQKIFSFGGDMVLGGLILIDNQATPYTGE